MYRESNSITINWELDTTSDEEPGRTAYSNITSFMKKSKCKTNRKLRATCALNLPLFRPSRSMCKLFCMCDPFYVIRASSILIKHASMHFKFFFYAKHSRWIFLLLFQYCKLLHLLWSVSIKKLQSWASSKDIKVWTKILHLIFKILSKMHAHTRRLTDFFS